MVAVSLKKVTDIKKQQQRLKQAFDKTRQEFNALSGKLGESIDDDSLAIFDVYKQLLEQANLGQEVSAKIAQGWRADSALKLVIEHYISQFEAIEDSYFRERASDIRDLGTRLLVNIQQQAKEELIFPAEFILLAQDVTASMAVSYTHLTLPTILLV